MAEIRINDRGIDSWKRSLHFVPVFLSTHTESKSRRTIKANVSIWVFFCFPFSPVPYLFLWVSLDQFPSFSLDPFSRAYFLSENWRLQFYSFIGLALVIKQLLWTLCSRATRVQTLHYVPRNLSAPCSSDFMERFALGQPVCCACYSILVGNGNGTVTFPSLCWNSAFEIYWKLCGFCLRRHFTVKYLIITFHWLSLKYFVCIELS